MEHFVEFEDVCKYYQTGSVKIAAADHLNFYVDKGEFCIIVGPSGAGKTTLLNILGGMDNCDEGNVWLDGRNVSRFSARELTTYRRYDVGFVFQFYNLVQNLTALENVVSYVPPFVHFCTFDSLSGIFLNNLNRFGPIQSFRPSFGIHSYVPN